MWFKPGHRPELKASVSRSYWYMSAAADPESGDFFSILLPWLNTETFQKFLDIFVEHTAKKREEGYEIWLCGDKAGWHLAKELVIPEGIKFIVMPTGAATINPAERIWDHIRKNFTRCKIFQSLADLEDTLTKAVLHLLNTPKEVISVCCTSMINKCNLI